MTCPSPGSKTSVYSFILLAIPVLLLVANAVAQENPEITFNRVSIPGLIRSAQISDIIQDKDGILWINASGLYRYDGFKFTLYKDVEDSNIKLNGKEISAIYYDS